MRASPRSPFAGGYLTLFRARGVPVRVHLATPLGLLLFTGFSPNPLLWAAYLVIVLCHEAGHAWVVRRCGLHVASIDVTGLGGVCRYTGQPTEVQESLIAWGGVLGQAVLLGVTELLVRSGMFPPDSVQGGIARAISVINVVLAAVNLLPLPRLDGWKAWALFRWRNVRRLGRRSRRGALKGRLRSLEAELRGLEPRGEEPKRPRPQDLN
jgi:stage IV sporulation protein FB